MDKEEFELLRKAYSPYVDKIINDNVRFYGFSQTIKWCFTYDEDMAIMATCDRKTNVISVNLKSFMNSYFKDNLMDAEYFILHEIRHVFQHLMIEDHKNDKDIPINPSIVEKWIYEGEHYIKSTNKDGSVNPEYFFQDCEMDAYAYSYAVMKYKYGNVDPWVYEGYKEEFWNIVNEWIETFKEEFCQPSNS